MLRPFSKIWLINISLAVCVVFFGIMSFDVWSKGDETIREIPAGKDPGKPLPGKRIVERTMPPDSNYGIVADKNLFSPNRSEALPEKPKPVAEPGPLKISEKMIFLYGVVLMGDQKKALISNPESGTQAGKKPAKEKWVKIGDTMGKFSVAEIGKDRIILADGANKHEILLYDKNKPKRQITVAAAPEKSAAPTVVATGPAAEAAAAAAKADAKTDAKTGGSQPKSATSEEKKASSTSTGEYKIINTPFGPIKKRIQ